MPNYHYHCAGCKSDVWVLKRISELDEPVACRVCGGDATRIPEAPAVLRESLPDGSVRQGWKEAKEVYKLEHEKLNTRDKKEKKYIDKQIKTFEKE